MLDIKNKLKIKIPKIKLKNIDRIDEIVEETKKSNVIETRYKKGMTIPEMKRYTHVKEMFEEITEKYPNNTLILEKFNHKEAFEEISYSKFKKDVLSLGTMFLEDLHLKGKRVLFLSENTYDWYVTYMTCLVTGIIAVPVDKELPAEELKNVIIRSEASAVVFSPKKKDVIDKIRESLKDVKYFIEMYSNNEPKDKDIGFNYLLQAGLARVKDKSDEETFLKNDIDSDEFKVLIFTSGTTANSKGVMLCNRNLVDNIYGALSYAMMDDKDRFFSILPLHHTYESTIGFLMPFSKGASIAVCEGLKYIVPNLKETKPTIMLTVPLLVESLYKKINASIKKSKKDKLVNSMIVVTNALKSVNIDVKRKIFAEILDNLGGNLRIIVSAAAPIDFKIGKWVEDIGIEFLQGYGLTETAPIAALTPEDKPKIGSVGKAVKCAEIKIDNPNENGEGEILIKSTTLMLGYYQMEEETKNAIVDGWFHSGDIGYMDEEGYVYITGRQKNVIVTRNGKNIYPEELELLIGKISYVKECMVYGYEDEDKDDWKVAVKVIPNYEEVEKDIKDGITDEKVYELIWKEIKEKVNKKLVSYKAIKRLEIKKDEFVKTTTMKIKRAEELKKNK